MVIRLSPLLLEFCWLLMNAVVYGQYASSFPDPIPLIHKSPYFNAWIGADGNETFPENRWPIFFSGPFLRWMIAARVDGTGYIFQGIHVNYTITKTVKTSITPTRTVFTIDAGPMRAELTFFTPIELNDWTLHSLPFAYAAINLSSTDGKQHDVQLYSDVTGQFVSSDPSNVIVWSTTTTSKSIYHRAQQRSFQAMTENNEMSEDGTQYFAYTTTPGATMTWQTCGSETCRVGFAGTGKLANTSDTDYRVIGGDWPVMAIALNLGNISQTSKPLVFALGLVRDPVAQYQTAGGLQNRTQLWWTRWSNVGAAIEDFLSGFSSAFSRTVDFDNKVTADSSAVASNYGLSSVKTNLTDLAILNLRQTIGSLEFTTSKPSNGQLGNVDDSRVFMKDMGSSRRVNPVEIIYASFPGFLYLNASLAGALLEPLLEFQSSPTLYNKVYAMPDLGSNWPNVLGNNTDQSSLGVENCGSMLIMALAHAQKSGDGRLIVKYYDLLRKWADFLVSNSLQPTSYMTADGVLGATSNLAIKGITGIYAMGKINEILEAKGEDPNRTSYYLSTARNYSQQWQSMALSADHVVSTYGNDSSWGLMYNLYAARLIQADIFSDKVYETQATFYASQSVKAYSFGLPFDYSQPYVGKSHWSFLTAGSIFNDTSTNGRDFLINMAHTRTFANPGWQPNPSTYTIVNGLPITGGASPALGAVYAFLALNLPNVAITFPSGAVGNTTSTKSKLAPILGGVLGSVAALVLVGAVAFFWIRHRRRHGGTSFVDGHQDRKTASFIAPFTDPASSVDNQVPNNSSTIEKASIQSPSSAPPSSNQVSPTPPSTNDPAVPLPQAGNSLGITSSPSGNSEVKVTPTPEDGLRREVEQLRLENEALRMQQNQQPAFVVTDYPDEPPPVYVQG